MNRGNSSSIGCLGIVVAIAVLVFVIKYAKVLFTIFKIGIIVSVLLIIAGIVLVIYFSVQKPTPKEEKKTPDEPQMQNQTEPHTAETPERTVNLTEEQRTALNTGRANLMELRRKSVKIKHVLIHSVSGQICTTAEKIIDTLREKPDAIPQARQFLNYYLPTIVNILSKYIRLESNGTPDQETTQNTLEHLIDIKHALDNQHKALFDDDKFDLSVEMEALKLACLRDGLLTEEDFQTQKENDTKPDLTL